MCQLEIIVHVYLFLTSGKFKTGQNGCKYRRAKRKKKQLGKNKLVYSIDSSRIL